MIRIMNLLMVSEERGETPMVAEALSSSPVDRALRRPYSMTRDDFVPIKSVVRILKPLRSTLKRFRCSFNMSRLKSSRWCRVDVWRAGC
ncbi:hypothetical protein TNCV_3749451 [Trichonephila clavipes]|nr:hypothetical protein TNCV_3749451 [Trichonephila clavipes]